jgi:hypothetical protein
MRFNRIYLAPEGDGGTGGGADANTINQPATVQATQEDKPVNLKEIVELRKETRETRDILKQVLAKIDKPASAGAVPEAKPPASNADAALAKVDDRLADMDFREAAVDLGIPAERRDLLKLAWNGAGRPKEDIRGWIKTMGAAFGQVAPQTAPAGIPVPPAAGSNTGAPLPLVNSPGQPEGDPMRWGPEVIAKMKPEEVRSAITDFQNRGSHESRILGTFAHARAEMEKRKPK